MPLAKDQNVSPPSLPPPHLRRPFLLFKGRDVHRHAFLLGDEGGQVQREAVGVVQQPRRVTCAERVKKMKTKQWCSKTRRVKQQRVQIRSANYIFQHRSHPGWSCCLPD